MFRYFRVPHLVLVMCLSLAAQSINAELPSGNAHTTRVRRLISRMILYSRLFVRIRLQRSAGNA